MALERITAPRSWRHPDSHWRVVLVHPWYSNLVQLRHHLEESIHLFFSSKAMISIGMPLTTSSISSPVGLGSDSMPVEVELFGVKAYLADSMQFMLEIGCRLHRRGVYYVMPSFRGEDIDRYHLPQFYHAEAEMSGGLYDAINLASELVQHLSASALGRCSDSLLELTGSLKHIEDLLTVGTRFPQMRIEDALLDLKQGPPSCVRHHPGGFDTITRAGETELVRRHGAGQALWLTHFDHLSVPFYQAYEPGTRKRLNADLILGRCETIGAGERHKTSEQVRSAMVEHQIRSEPYNWYAQLRDDHPMQTAGFGMGLERFLMWLLQHDDIRDLTVLYRENRRSVVP